MEPMGKAQPKINSMNLGESAAKMRSATVKSEKTHESTTVA